MHVGKPLEIHAFDSADNPLNALPLSQQLRYIKGYLVGANVQSVLVERNYFDRDYLAEFSGFYSKSARGYSNICSRLHFFRGALTREMLDAALGGQWQDLQTNYLGFIILRPLPTAPFGRTVLAWYENNDEHSERITPVLREYTSNILGIQLKVSGIPWQQQDRGVSACATIALWSMLHSSAFDAHHAVPTTVEITQKAFGVSLGSRAFPSKGLSVEQLMEAIYAQNLSPKILLGHSEGRDKPSGFLPEYLASMCAAHIRSGYPVLLVGDYLHGDYDQAHAVCCIGFREKEQQPRDAGSCSTMDDETEVFYIHDDNIGPNVRCRLINRDNLAVLETCAPDYIDPDIAEPKEPFLFRPTMMIIAVHEEIRMDASSLTDQAEYIANVMSSILNNVYDSFSLERPAISYNAQFLDVRNFFGAHLVRVTNNNPHLLAKIRFSIGENARPLCLHIGLVSIGLISPQPTRLIDVIYDTTDSAICCPIIAHVVYDPVLKKILDQIPAQQVADLLGQQIIGFL